MREYGSEHSAIVLSDSYFESLFKYGREVLFLRSGREALLLAAMIASTKKNKTILFPAYCCWSMRAPFEKVGWRVVYYRLKEDLTVDTVHLRHLLEIKKPQAILTMNFYGSALTNDTVSMVKDFDNRIKIIEDFSHCVFSFKQIYNPKVDIYVSSIRKSIGVCDGSVILSNTSLPVHFIQNEDKYLADKRYMAQTEKFRYAYSKDLEKKGEYLYSIRECESIFNEFIVVRPISDRARRQLAQVNGAEIAFARRENMRHLWSLLNGKVEMVPGLERSFEGAPFSLPILVDNRDVVQTTLAQKGLYTQLLWPISEDAKQICSVSKMMDARMLSLPIDQRYIWDDIEDMADIICDVLCV